jgi:predicted nucleic acid-binding protein
VSRAADTSVAVAAILADHEAHDLAEDALSTCTKVIVHVAIETYSVLTRLHPPLRLDPSTAAQIVDARLPSTRVTLDGKLHAAVPATLAAAGVSGGATYDGLIALTALEHDLELLSRDRRAARTYRALGVRHQLLGD